MNYKNEEFIKDLADGYSEEVYKEVKELYAKAKTFDYITKAVLSEQETTDLEMIKIIAGECIQTLEYIGEGKEND